jgi:hypothetical protein
MAGHSTISLAWNELESSCLKLEGIKVLQLQTIERWIHIYSCIIAHPISTKLPLLAPFLAPTTMASVKRRVNTLSIATNFSVLALVSTHTTVQAISLHIDTFLIAAVRPGAALQATNPRKLIASHVGRQVLLCKKAAHPSQRRSCCIMAAFRQCDLPLHVGHVFVIII